MAVIRKNALSFKCGDFAKRYPDHEATDLLQEAEGLITDMDSEIEELRTALHQADLDGYRTAFFEIGELLGMTAQPFSPKEVWETQMRPALHAAIAAQGPVPMVLHCPRCHLQHIDAPDERTPDWQNPPHRSHLCHGCGLIWRPADVPTIGVESTVTAGKSDSPFVTSLSTQPVACLLFDKNGVLRRTRAFTADGKYVFDAGALARLNEGNPQLAPFTAKLAYAIPTTYPADLSEYRDAVMHAYGVVEPDEYCEKLGELLDLIDGKEVP